MPYNKFQVIENIKHYMRDKPIKRRAGFKPGGIVEPGVTHYGKWVDIDIEEVDRLRKQNKTTKQIADELGVGKSTLERRIAESGLDPAAIGTKVSPERLKALDEATEFFDPGKKWKDINKDHERYRQILDGADRIEGKYKADLTWDEYKTKSKREKAELIRKQWIADNGSKYDNPNKFIKAYEKHFNHKLGSKTDALFHVREGQKGRNIYLGRVTDLWNPAPQKDAMFYFKKGFSEEEVFKASIIQNNKEVQEKLKKLFKNIDFHLDDYAELGPESIIKNLKKQGGELFGADKGFDWIKATTAGTRDIGGVHTGIVRNSLLQIGIPEEHLKSFQEVRQPIRAIEQILKSIKERPDEVAKRWGVGRATAVKIGSQLDNFLSGRGEIDSIIRRLDYALGSKKFNEIFGGVNFEHSLAKRFGQDYKYLPRNYLLKGQFTTQKFNMIKRDVFDKPLIDLMRKYTKNPTDARATEIQALINKFNEATNTYADFTFDSKKGKLVYPKGQKVIYDLSRYADPGQAKKELIQSIHLGQTDKFQQAYATHPLTGDLGKKSVHSFIESTEGKDLRRGAKEFIEDMRSQQTTQVDKIAAADAKKIKVEDVVTKAARTGLRGLLGWAVLPEIAFGLGDYAHQRGKGLPPSRALGQALENFTFGAYETGAHDQAIMDQLSASGYDLDGPEAANLQTTMDLGKNVSALKDADKKYGEALRYEDMTSGAVDPSFLGYVKSSSEMEDVIRTLETEQDQLVQQLYAYDKPLMGFNLFNQLLQKDIIDIENRTNPLKKGFLKDAFKQVPRGPDPYAKDERGLYKNTIFPEYVHPIEGSSVSPRSVAEHKQEYYPFMNLAGGGITTLDPLKPWALPPEAGPVPRGQKIKEGVVSLIK